MRLRNRKPRDDGPENKADDTTTEAPATDAPEVDPPARLIAVAISATLGTLAIAVGIGFQVAEARGALDRVCETQTVSGPTGVISVKETCHGPDWYENPGNSALAVGVFLVVPMVLRSIPRGAKFKAGPDGVEFGRGGAGQIQGVVQNDRASYKTLSRAAKSR